MVKRKAIISQNIVENIIVCDDNFTLADKILIEISNEIPVSIGWKYEDGKFIEVLTKSDPRDYPLKRWQFKAMINFLGVKDDIERVINNLSDPFEKAVIMARYQESDIYLRSDPLFDQLAPLVGLTLEKLDEAWLQIARG